MVKFKSLFTIYLLPRGAEDLPRLLRTAQYPTYVILISIIKIVISNLHSNMIPIASSETLTNYIDLRT